MFIGARGSGEGATAEFRGIGPAVYRMATAMRSRLAKSKLSMATLPNTYEADSVNDLVPSKREAAAIAAAGPVAGASIYYKRNVRRYLNSIDQGIRIAVAEIRQTAAGCPGSSIVLAGYSQGAMVMHQAQLQLADAGVTDVLAHIAGSLLLGDGDRVSNSAARDFGSSQSRAQGVRTYLRGIPARDVVDPADTASICNARDIVCDFNFARIAAAKRAATVHTTYVRRGRGNTRIYDPVLGDAAEWLARRIIRARAPQEPPLIIDGSRSFGGMPNPGSLQQAIDLFGAPASLQGDDSRIGCTARWPELGIAATFANYGAARDGPACAPAKDFVLVEALLNGPRWITDRGLRIGDTVAKLQQQYPEATHPPDCVGPGLTDPDLWRLERVADPLGGPGSYICTLAVVVRDQKVRTFELSSQAASE